MTVSSVITPDQYTGNAVTTSFPITWAFTNLPDAQVLVRADGVAQTLNSDYTISAQNVVFTTAPASGVAITIKHNPDFLQGTDYTSNDPFPANSHEGALDKLARATQFLKNELRKAIRIPDEDPVADDPELVAKADRANLVLGFDASGDVTLVADATASALPVPVPVSQGGTGATTAATAMAALGAARTLTAGNGLTGGGTLAADRSFAVASSNDGIEVATDAIVLNLSLFRGFKSGLVPSNNTTDGDHDLDFTAGVAWALDGSDFVEVAAMTKQLDAAFAAGTDAGALGDGEALPTSGTIHVFAIKNDSTGAGDILADTDSGGANVPTGWTVIRRVFSITTDGSANLTGVSVRELAGGALEVVINDPPIDINTGSLGTTSTAFALSVPSGFNMLAMLNVKGSHGSVNSVIYVRTDTVNDEDASASAAPLATLNAPIGSFPIPVSQILCRTNPQAQIAAVSNSASTSFGGVTLGWTDELRG